MNAQLPNQTALLSNQLNLIAARVEMIVFGLNPFCNPQTGELTSHQVQSIAESLEGVQTQLRQLSDFVKHH